MNNLEIASHINGLIEAHESFNVDIKVNDYLLQVDIDMDNLQEVKCDNESLSFVITKDTEEAYQIIETIIIRNSDRLKIEIDYDYNDKLQSGLYWRTTRRRETFANY